MQANIQDSMAVRPSALGVLVVTLLKMLTNTRKSVTSRAVRPSTTSRGIKKDIQEAITKSPEGEVSFMVVYFPYLKEVEVSSEYQLKPCKGEVAKCAKV